MGSPGHECWAYSPDGHWSQSERLWAGCKPVCRCDRDVANQYRLMLIHLTNARREVEKARNALTKDDVDWAELLQKITEQM